jgi:hypothetical protein
VADPRSNVAPPIKPWWETLDEDPWYATAGKAVLGEREYNDLARSRIMHGDMGALQGAVFGTSPGNFQRDVLPIISTLAPLLFMGKGGGEGAALEGMRPEMPVSPEEMLPPETKTLLDKVRSYEPPPQPPSQPPPSSQFFFSGDPFTPPQYVPPPIQSSRPPGVNLFDYEALPYAEAPYPRGKLTGKDIELPPPPTPATHEQVGPVDWNWYSPQKPPPGKPKDLWQGMSYPDWAPPPPPPPYLSDAHLPLMDVFRDIEDPDVENLYRQMANKGDIYA